MNTTALQKKSLTLFQEYGYVKKIDSTYSVQTDVTTYLAERAASCLLDPVVGDKVLLVTDTGHGAYILAVLERAGQQTAQLSLPGDTQINTTEGRLTFLARDGFSMETSRDLSVLATQMNVSAVQADITINNVSLIGEFWRACIDRIKLVGSSVDLVLERSHQRLVRSYRHVEETDHVTAGQIDYQAGSTLALHSKYTLMTAEELVKVDADQIHMG